MTYSPAEDTKIINLRQQGYTWKQIADKVNRSKNGVRKHYHRLLKKDNNKNPESVEKSDVKRLEKIIEQQQEQIDHLRLARRLFFPSPSSSKSEGNFCRVIIPDTHGCFIDTKAASAFLSDLEIISPREVVLLGDHLDCGGFLAQHHTTHFIAQTNYTFEDDANAANQFLDEVQLRAPEAVYHYLEGNHELRIERQISTWTVRNPKDAEYLSNLFSIHKVLHLEDRHINYYKQSDYYHGLPIQGTIRLNNCHFTHGSTTAKHAAAKMLDIFGGNIVFGHVHRSQQIISETVHAGSIGAWCPGCLCQKQPLWNFTNVTGWTHGYGLQLVNPNTDRFLHINVPIIDGESLLGPLTEQVQ